MPLVPEFISRQCLVDMVVHKIDLLRQERPGAPNTTRWMAGSTRFAAAMFERIGVEALAELAETSGLTATLHPSGLVYPDLELVTPDARLYAIDIKTCQLQTTTSSTGFTLGTYRGYFRGSRLNLRSGRLYDDYEEHWILGFVYDRRSPFDCFEVIVWPKYRLAGRRTGSRNTSNIGSVTDLEALRQGLGPFAALGERAFVEFWRAYEPGTSRSPRAA
jgi:hypothetical protein